MARFAKNALLVLVCLAAVVPAVLLVTGVLPYKILVVHTGSMTPTIPSRSAVFVREGTYRVGQVISFETPNGVVTHRLVARRSDGMLVTKGDANRTADPGLTSPARVIGGVIAAPRMLGYWLVYLKNPAGAASLLLTLVCLWLVYSITEDLAGRQQRALAAPAQAAPVVPVPAGPRPIGGEAAPMRLEPQPVSAAAPTFAIGGGSPRRVWRPVAWKNAVVFECSTCGASFTSVAELRSHAAVHGEPLGEPRNDGRRELIVTVPFKDSYAPRWSSAARSAQTDTVWVG